MDWLDIVPAHYNFVKNEELFEIILGLTSPSMIDISKFIESQNESQESFETVFKESWPETPSA